MSARDEMDFLLRMTAKLAQAQLQSKNRMHFGAILESGRQIKMLVPESIKKNATWDELRAYWKSQLVTATSTTQWIAASACTFTSLCAFAEQVKDDAAVHTIEIPQALVIHIEHSNPELQPEYVAYPYQGSLGSEITFGEPTRAAGERWIPSATNPVGTDEI